MFKYWLRKSIESVVSTLPIFFVVLTLFILQKTVLPAPATDTNLVINDGLMVFFGICCLLIMVGLTIFSVGSESSMSEIGKIVGNNMAQKKNLFFVLF